MKISGFTFVRNAISLGYPIPESLNSLLPVCDELVIAVGKSDDNTLEIIQSINNPKIKIIETEWDDNLRRDGLIYSEQTNVALNNCSGDWCIYLQADELLHEDDYGLISDEINNADKQKDLEGLLFRYHHFYGSYDFVGTGRQWYRREIRAIKNTGNVVSWGDAQGFRIKSEGQFRKIRAKQTNIRVFHYGWVRPPKVQMKKIIETNAFYHGKNSEIANYDLQDFDYSSAFSVKIFNQSHPALMKQRIEESKQWADLFEPKKMRKKPFLVALSDKIESISGMRIGEFKDFIEVK